MRNPDLNDPRSQNFPLDPANLDRSPVYIRFEPESSSDNWNVRAAAVLVYTGNFLKGYTPPPAFDNLWLGQSMGKVLFLTEEHGEGVEMRLRDRMRDIAEQMRQ